MATPSSPGMTIDQLRRFVDRLEAVEPDAQGRYNFYEKVYTKTGWRNYVRGFKEQLADMEGAAQIGSEQRAEEKARRNKKEIDRVQDIRLEVNNFLTDFVQAYNQAATVQDEDRLKVWRDYYQNKLRDINRYLDGLIAGNMQPGDVSVEFEKYQPEQILGTFEGGETTPSGRPTSSSQPTPVAEPDISNITSKEQARTEIARLRQRSNTLKGLIGETKNGVTLYYEVPGSAGMSKGQRDAIVANIEAKIAAVTTKWFAETPAAAAPGTSTTGSTAGQRGESSIMPGTTPTTTTVGGPSLTGGLVPVVIPDTTATPSSDIPVETTPPAETPERITTPDVVADTTPEVVSDTAPIATPTGPSYTDPATGVTYQPGETIGGEDRSLPNGGGVVNGVYIPPGIDYTWLGQQVPSDWEEAAQELYGGYYEMLKQVPELGRLLKEAFEKGWEPGSTSFQYALEQTDWWKTTNASARAWQEKLIRDPATATAERDTRVALLRGVAQDMGITLSPESLEKLATDSIILNFQLTSQYEDVIGSEARKSAGGVSQLRYGFVGDSIRKVANQYGIALSDITFNEWVDKIAVGAESAETFEAYASQTARNLYPSLTSGFERGLTFGQMTDPYAQIASRILEIPWAQVDFTDPKWAAAFTMRNDKGDQTQMSYGEWADYLRTNKSFGYEYTDEAVSKAYTIVNDLAEAFGRA